MNGVKRRAGYSMLEYFMWHLLNTQQLFYYSRKHSAMRQHGYNKNRAFHTTQALFLTKQKLNLFLNYCAKKCKEFFLCFYASFH